MKQLKILTTCLLLAAAQCAVADTYVLTNSNKPFSEVNTNVKTHSPAYHNTIADISIDYEGALLAGTIRLDNGVVLRIVDYKSRDDNEMKTWGPGDVLRFESRVLGEKGLLLSAKKINGNREGVVEPYLVYDVIDGDSKTCLTIKEINEEGKYIKLSDETVWGFGYFAQFSTKYWKVGEHVLIQGSRADKSYDFINLNVSTLHNASNATAEFAM